MRALNIGQRSSLFTEELILEDVFIKEDFSEEHQMIADMTKSFVEQDLFPVLPEIEKQNFSIVKQMIEKSGKLGLLGIDIPEKYGGMELDKVSGTIITEILAKSRSFSITYSGQVGIGSLPIVYYGSHEQKKKYLPSVASGKMIGAYALTEPDAGTDALGIKTVAKLSEDGTHYVINGEKQFITNASFADFFILYAKVDGEHFTAFIIDKETDGLTIGSEEQKMGLKGTSTTSIVLNDVKVPVENVLGEIGQGHLIAFNILNIGRHKLSATCLGTAKRALELTISHVKERKQFKRSISEFNLTKEKIAKMTALIFAMESIVYRTAGEFEKCATYTKRNGIPFRNILKDYALECSVSKVFASEMLDYIVDESLQLHGGYGYISDYEIETLYRDSRINRIFEGTNEINRIVIANAMLKNIDKFILNRNIKEGNSIQLESDWNVLYLLKEFTFYFIKEIKNLYSNLKEEQELLSRIADITIFIYVLESNLLRLEKLRYRKTSKEIKYEQNLVKVFTGETIIECLSKVFSIPIRSSKLKKIISKLLVEIDKSRIDLIIVKRRIADTVFKKRFYE